MTDKQLDLIVANDVEWRKMLVRRLEKIEDKQESLLVTVTTLKVKFGIIGLMAGMFGGGVIQFLMKKL